MAVLALREFDRIDCGEFFDPATRKVRKDQHRALERFSEQFQAKTGTAVFQHGPRQSLVAQNMVGVVNIGHDQVEVLPKIEGDVPQVRNNLAKMIAIVMDLDVHDDDLTKADRYSDSILEVLIRLFCQKLWQCVRRGMVRRYEVQRENLSTLRGRLSISDQIRHNLARPDRLACIFDEFTEDNPLNQALKAALRVLSKVARSQQSQREVAELLFCFHGVDDVTPRAVDWGKIKTDRLSSRYRPVLSMARLFIEGASPDVMSGTGDGFALLFDMNVLFERYIGSVVKRVFGGAGIRISLQGPVRHLARVETGAAAFQLKPDVVASGVDGIEFVIDTKWKRLKDRASKEGVTSSDIYQMYAYSTQYATKDVVLLYPHHNDLGDWRPRRAQYWVNGINGSHQDTGRRISVSTVDLRDLQTVPKQLESIIFPTLLDSAFLAAELEKRQSQGLGIA